MKKAVLCVFLAVLLLLFSACTATVTTAHAYPHDTHTHVYGSRYVMTEATCLEAGVVVRYCKICHASRTETVAVPADMALRAHLFLNTVVEPTESTEGYTAKHCTLCAYEIAKTDVVPAKYALFTDAATQTVAPTGALALVMSDTATHVLAYLADGDAAVPADAACRLAVALTLADELTKADAAVTPDTAVAFGGGSFSAKRLLFAVVEEYNTDALRALALAICGSETAFSALVSARLARLGVGDAVTVSPFAPEAGEATLQAVAVLTARVLDEPLLAEAFGEAVGLRLVAGRSPVLYLSSADGTLRVTALTYADTVRFAVAYGTALPQDYEMAIYPAFE